MNAAQTLGYAAGVAKEMHSAATPGPWVNHGDRVTAEFMSTDNDGFTDTLVEMGLATSDDLHLIADMRGVVEHLAPMFWYAAEFVEANYAGDDFPESSLPTWVLTVLPVARAVNAAVTA